MAPSRANAAAAAGARVAPGAGEAPRRRRRMSMTTAAAAAAALFLLGASSMMEGASAFLLPSSHHGRQQQQRLHAAAAPEGASGGGAATTTTTTPIDITAPTTATTGTPPAAAASASAPVATPYTPGGSGLGGPSPSALASSLDPIGRIDANPQALLDWVKQGRGVIDPAVGLTNLIGEEGLPTGSSDSELARWALQATGDVKAGTVLVSIPNILTLGPTRRKYKLPPSAAGGAGGTGGVQLQEVLRSLGAGKEKLGGLESLLAAAVIDERIQRVMDSFPEAYWRIKLAVLLVAERMKGPQSFWWPYLRNLPEKFAYMPIFYNNSEFGSIQIPSLMRTVQSRCRMLVNISDGYLRQLASSDDQDQNPFLDDVHANDMGWGLCAASSRALRHIPGIAAPTMVPLIDFAQHAVDPSCHVADYRTSGGSVQLVASRDIRAGELLTLSYGNLTNADLLLDYGFTLPDNPHDRFDFTLSDDLVRASQKLMAFESEPFGDKRVPGLLQPWQEKVLDALDLAPKINGTPYWPPVKMAFGGPNRVDGRLLALLRTMYCRDRRLLAVSNVTYEGLQSYKTQFRISTFERRALMHALGIAATLLRRLPTTLTEDWRLLTGEALYIGHDEDSRTVVFRSLPEGDESRDELMETVTTDESVVKEYNPYREAELMERREPVIQYMGGSLNRCMREILRFRIGQKKILYQVISDICHSMYGHGLVQSVNDMEELEEERALMAQPEESSRPINPNRGAAGGARSLDSILEWAERTFGEDAGL